MRILKLGTWTWLIHSFQDGKLKSFVPFRCLLKRNWTAYSGMTPSQRATKLLQGYRDALHFAGVRDRVVDSLAGQPQREPARAWVPPPRSCYKVNWEACMDSATQECGRVEC
uniref:Uncharacterized protein n=1 Tax=Fagus sylvatica TaxID=28930 RepID=A0A2N9IYL0_FAGSY